MFNEIVLDHNSAFSALILHTLMMTGLQDFPWYNIPKGGGDAPRNIPNSHNMYQIRTKYTN
jgi:hypothetical protein